MTSFISWMDYSEHERRQALDVIDLFNEQDTRDELGIGSVRDAFADILFPGTSTIQTRARYFLFIPWIYLELERLKVSSKRVKTRAQREEYNLITALVKAGEQDGVIGFRARSSLKRLPSNIYWQGLGRWGIRTYQGSQEQYHRSLDSFYHVKSRQQHNDDGEVLDGKVAGNWRPNIPNKPEGFPKDATFSLGKAEAEYLQERILASAPGTLLAFLVSQGKEFDKVAFPWQHLQSCNFPKQNQKQLGHARNFSEVIHGAALLYNLMLAELAEEANLSNIVGLVDDYKKKLQEWAMKIQEREDLLRQWNREEFWTTVLSDGARVTEPTKRFINQWLDLILVGGGEIGKNARSIADNEDARQLLHLRERVLKRKQARLDNQRALELWSGAAGTAQLSYRWPVSQNIILDIVTGLKGGN